MDVPTVPSNFAAIRLEEQLTGFIGDIRDLTVLQAAMEAFNPEIIFHLAAQSRRSASFAEPFLTFETNALGTLNVLEVSAGGPKSGRRDHYQ